MIQSQTPIIIAHRGASGYFPEHSAASYEAAIAMGADFIEPDLVFTADGHLICRHDRYLGTTTNVADLPVFADRRVRKPGNLIPQWYAEDFTLAEIKTLRCRQAWPSRSIEHNDQQEVLTFAELLQLINREAANIDRPVGVCPEIKHAPDLLALGFDFLPPAFEVILEHGFGTGHRPVFFQSFDPDTLKRAAAMCNLPLVQLIRNEDANFGKVRPSSIAEDAADYATVIAPHKSLVIGTDGEDTGFVKRCHDMGKLVHVWAFVPEVVGPGFESMEEEIAAHIDLGIDGLFSDFPDRAKTVRDQRA
jgi:glycerophosphoryl diester phosphodiesterase